MKNGLVLLAILSGLCMPGCREKIASRSAPTVERGWEEYSFGAFDAAVNTFGEIVNSSAKEGELHAQALYGLATVWNLRRPGENAKKARQLYQDVLTGHPQSDFAAWSELALARMTAILPVGQRSDPAALRTAYQRVIDLFPGRMAAEEAAILQQVTLLETFQKNDAQTAKAALTTFIASHGNSYYLSFAHSLLADCHWVLGDASAQLAEEIAALEIHEKQGVANWRKKHGDTAPFVDATTTSALFKIANLAEFEAGDFVTARKYYQRFIQENPTEKRNFYARQALERMDRTEARLRSEIASPRPTPNPS